MNLIETVEEFEYLTQLFRSNNVLKDNRPVYLGLVQDTSANDYSEPSVAGVGEMQVLSRTHIHGMFKAQLYHQL